MPELGRSPSNNRKSAIPATKPKSKPSRHAKTPPKPPSLQTPNEQLRLKRLKNSKDIASALTTLIQEGCEKRSKFLKISTCNSHFQEHYAPPLLPLYFYDSSLYETRTAKEWITDRKQSPAAIFIPRDQTAGGGEIGGLWKNATIIGIASEESDTNTDMFFYAQLKDLPQQICVPRIFVCFAEEDRTNFVARYFDACKRRSKAETTIKYVLYVKSMPSDALQTSSLSDEQIERILQRTKAHGKSKLSMGQVGEAAVLLIKEATKEYEMVQNQFVFDACVAFSSPEELSFLDLTVPEPTLPLPVPKSALVSCEVYNYMTSFEGFISEVLIANVSVIPALLQV
jgi:hypothetical protein